MNSGVPKGQEIRYRSITGPVVVLFIKIRGIMTYLFSALLVLFALFVVIMCLVSSIACYSRLSILDSSSVSFLTCIYSTK